MKQQTIAFLCIIVLLTCMKCKKESSTGHLKLKVTYPEAVVIPEQPTYFVPVPGIGADVRLYNKDAICKGYKDAMLDIVWIGDEFATSKYKSTTDEQGKVLFNNIPSGEYLLIVYARQISKYSEIYVEVNAGDTLILRKDFTPDGAFFEDLEPWDHEVPGY